MATIQTSQIECFLSVSKTLSFTQSAVELGLTQPSVSRQIRLLEDNLQTQLFVRDQHNVNLTSEGRDFLKSVEPFFEALRSAVERTRDRKSNLIGPLRVGCLPEIGQNLFFRQLLDFQKLHPEIRLHVQYLLNHEILAKLQSGELDFGIASKPSIGENYRSYKLYDERTVLVTSAGNVAYDDVVSGKKKITDLHFVGYSELDALLTVYLKSFHSSGDLSKLTRFSSVSSHRSMIEYLLANKDAFAVIPFFSVEDLVEKKKLKLVGSDEKRSTIYLIETEKHITTKRTEALRKHLLR